MTLLCKITSNKHGTAVFVYTCFSARAFLFRSLLFLRLFLYYKTKGGGSCRHVGTCLQFLGPIWGLEGDLYAVKGHSVLLAITPPPPPPSTRFEISQSVLELSGWYKTMGGA